VGSSDVCFFVQAEDGIRDATVTGVQTCALPISPFLYGGLHSRQHLRFRSSDRHALPPGQTVRGAFFRLRAGSVPRREHRTAVARSEERRVGKELGFWSQRLKSRKRKNGVEG